MSSGQDVTKVTIRIQKSKKKKFFFESGSHSAQVGLDLIILLPQLPECHDYSHTWTPQLEGSSYAGLETRADVKGWIFIYCQFQVIFSTGWINKIIEILFQVPDGFMIFQQWEGDTRKSKVKSYTNFFSSFKAHMNMPCFMKAAMMALWWI